MKAGKLDTRVKIMRDEHEPAPDPWGFPIPAQSVEVASPWAEVVKSSTHEYFRTEGSFRNGVVVFRIRWRSDVKLTDYVMWDGVRYEVEEIVPLGRREGLELRCKGFIG